MVCHFQDWVIKRHCGFSPGCTLTLSWVARSRVGQLLREGQGNEEMKSFATSQGERASQEQPYE